MTNIQEKLTAIVAEGLSSGVGDPAKPGSLCIESAICLALGEPHSDKPSCVAAPDRAYSITINDAQWSSPKVRAKALLPLGLAQLGTAGTDRAEWAKRLALRTVQEILPIALRLVVGFNPALIDACEQAETLDAAADAARAAARAARAATAAAAAYAARAAAAADAYSAARAAAAAADAYAAAAADAAAYVARVAAAAADAAYEEVLNKSVQIALDCYEATKKGN